MTVAESLDRALRAAGIPIDGVSIGRAGTRTTWRVDYTAAATPQHRIDGEALRLSFNPADATVVDANRLSAATLESGRFDVLATCALVAKYTDQAGWAAMTPAQKMARVRTLAQDWRGFRVFVEANT